MKRIGIICKTGRKEPLEILKELLPWLRKVGQEVVVDSETAEQLNMEGVARISIPSLVDLVIVLGGDGTMLSVARLIGDQGVPILGVNLGGLGFLTEVTRDDLYRVMEQVLTGNCPVEERIMLRAVVFRNGRAVEEHTALNDAVINKGALARIIEMETYVGDAHLTTFRADGLIISSPTGSTAYSLSAGGPILYPTLHSIVLTPICPHTITNRPIVLTDSATIRVTLLSRSETVYLTLDGQIGVSLLKDDMIEVRKSDYTMKLLIPCQRDFFQTIRAKLKWSGRVDQGPQA